jgi:tetrapyrrole methylase family protein/MazG family protein
MVLNYPPAGIVERNMKDSNSHAQKNLTNLLEIIRKLRSPDGCLWDRAQKREDIVKYLMGEAYELVDAIETGSVHDIKEEMGDLLFQILFLARIVEESGDFDISDVMEAVSEKMIRRHPHVFGNKKVKNIEDIKTAWDDIKKHRENGNEPSTDSFFKKIPRSLPSLLRAQKVSERASSVGFDWGSARDVFHKIEEETNELNAALKTGEGERIKGEIGDLLFSLVNLCRFVDVDAEDALRATIEKFTGRFRYIHDRLRDQGKSLTDTKLEEMDILWNEAKDIEKMRKE